jgi:hypothetical protein
MDSQALDAYIEAFRAEGVLHGEGSFTLDRQKAISKLARHLLPENGSWVLRVLQAAHRWGAVTVRSIETRAYSRLEMELPSLVQVRHIRSAMTDQSCSDEAAEIFCQGIRALGGGEGRVVAFSVQDCNGASNFLLADGNLSETEENGSTERENGSRIVLLSPRETSHNDILERGVNTKWQFAKDFVGRTHSPEYRQIYTRGRATSCRLWLNGERMDDLDIPGPASALVGTDFIGVLHARPDEPDSGLVIPHGISRHEKAYREGLLPPLHGPLAWLAFRPGDRAACLLAVHSTWDGTRASPKAFSTLRFVKDGVIVGSATSHYCSPIVFDLLVSPSGMKTDLSGIKADIPESIMERYQDYLTQFRAPLSKLSQYLSGFSSYHRSKVVHQMDGMDVGSKLRFFASGALKRRRHHATQLARILREQPFKNHGLGSL